MSSNKTDEEIILEYQNGNQKVFKDLVDRYTPSIYGFTWRFIDKNNAPDIVQEVFIKVWKNLNKFDPLKASFKTWIFTITRNTITDFLRKKKNILFSDLDKNEDNEKESFSLNIPDENILPDEMIQKLEDTKFLNETLEKIPFNYREILTLYYQEEMTFKEIGEVLNKPLNTVKSQHRRAIIELRKILS